MTETLVRTSLKILSSVATDASGQTYNWGFDRGFGSEEAWPKRAGAGKHRLKF